jgi:hypothetical protein
MLCVVVAALAVGAVVPAGGLAESSVLLTSFPSIPRRTVRLTRRRSRRRIPAHPRETDATLIAPRCSDLL